MKKLYASRYNIAVQAPNGSYILYNCSSGCFAVLSEDDYVKYEQLCEANSYEEHFQTSEMSQASAALQNSAPHNESIALNDKSALLDKLLEGKFLTENNPKEELAAQRRAFEQVSKDTSVLNLNIAPTYHCNFSCPYCYERNHIPHKGIMSSNVIEQICFFVEQLYEKQHFSTLYVQWYGGEPTLALKQINTLSSYFMQFCASQNIAYDAMMISNGYLIDKSAAKQLANNKISEVLLTLDGPKELNNARRVLSGKNNANDTGAGVVAGAGSSCGVDADFSAGTGTDSGDGVDTDFSAGTADGAGGYESKDAIPKNGTYENIVQAAKNLQKENIHVLINMNLDKVSAKHFNEMYKQFAAENLELVCEQLNDYGGKMYGKGAFVYPSFDLFTHEEYAQEIHDLASKRNINAREIEAILKPCSYFCRGQLENYFVIDLAGDVYCCDGYIGQEGHKRFSIFDDEQTWKLHDVTFNACTDEKCSTCEILPICQGSCIWERETCCDGQGNNMPCHPLKTTIKQYLLDWYNR